MWGKGHCLDTRCGEGLTKRLSEQRVPIVEQKPLAHQEAIDGIGEQATALDHPRTVRLGRDAGDLDTSRRQLDDEQHGVPRNVQKLVDIP
jgi:hypothetical protein